MSVAGLFSAVGAAVTWGAVYTLDQQILKSTSSLALLLINSMLTALIAAPFLLSASLRGAVLAVRHATWPIVIASLLLAALANALIFVAIKLLGASTASIFEISYPLFVVIFSAVFIRGRVTLPFMIGALFVLVGSAIIVATSA